MLLSLRHRLDLSGHPRVMAILNVTPDSFYDGGSHASLALIVKRAEECVQEGADLLDIGGQSTGPESLDVSVEEELKRVLPAVKGIRERFPDTFISIDTFQSEVAEQALEAGADMINDVTAGRGDPAMFELVARSGCPIVLMYSKDPTARTTRAEKEYVDVVKEIREFLEERIGVAVKSGIDPDKILVDPGLGHFVSADPKYSFEILERLREFTSLGPVLVSPSRKSFLAGSENLSVSERLPATLRASVLAVKNGASIIRTHDALQTRRAIDAFLFSEGKPKESKKPM